VNCMHWSCDQVPSVYLMPVSTTQARTTAHNWDEDDEVAFTAMLEKELDKIHDFQQAKVSAHYSRIGYLCT
jgi:SPX domain protein involved in polyphosphate accumulation